MITYRNILESDYKIQERVRLWRNSDRVKAGMLNQSPISADQHRQWIDSLSKKTGLHEVRVSFSDSIPFGIINLRDINTDIKSCDWGYYIGDDAFLGQKLGMRLLYDLTDWGFSEAGMYKMYSTVRSDNLKALHDELQAGYHIEGFLKDHLLSASGELIGIYLIAQFQTEWVKNKEKISSWAKIGD